MKKTIATLTLSAGLLLGSAGMASAVPTLPGPDNPHSTSTTWTDIHTGEAQYVCDKTYRGKYNNQGHKIPKWKRIKYTNCRVVY